MSFNEFPTLQQILAAEQRKDLFQAASDQTGPISRTVPGATWTPITVKNPTLLNPIGWSGIAVRFTNIPPRGLDITNTVVYTARRGVCYFPTRGVWWVFAVNAGGETFLQLDCADPASALINLLLLGTAGLLPVDITTIGGTTQTGVDVTATFASLTMAAPTTAAVGVASGQIIAVDTTRRFFYVKNTSTAGQRISLSMSGAAVVDSGITLGALEAISMNALDNVTTQVVNAISSAAGGAVAIQTGT